MEPQESVLGALGSAAAVGATNAAESGREEAPMRLRRAMTILHLRCSRLAVVLDGAYNSLNQQATIRTAEAMGLQCVFIVDSSDDSKHAVDGKLSDKVTKGSYKWLTVRSFQTASECIQHLRQEGWNIWTTELAPDAIPLDNAHKQLFDPLPQKVAVVIGKESAGVEQAFVEAADKRVYLPMFGFTESFNLSVATALVLQRLFDWYPELRGSLKDEPELFEQVQQEWLGNLAKNPTATAKIARAMNQTEDIQRLLLDDLREQGPKVPYIPPKIQKRQKRKLEQGDGEEQGLDADGSRSAEEAQVTRNAKTSEH